MPPWRAAAAAALLLAVPPACRAADPAAAPAREDASAPAASAARSPGALPLLGLSTTLPIYWSESGDIAQTLASPAPPHFARTELEQAWRLQPLDTLDAASLAPLRFLLLAQPRALTGEENVALDAWVRGGGRLLLLADPWLTGHSEFGIGDPRRPQDVALLSPILARWGLELTFAEEDSTEERWLETPAGPLPVELAGQWRLVPTEADAPASCRLAADAVLAECTIGRGRATILADAALVDGERGDERRAAALRAVARRAFAGETR